MNPLPGVFLLCAMACAGHAATYYVATNGSNSNPGTLAQPWRSVQKAADSLAPGDTAYVRRGVYKEAVTSTSRELRPPPGW